MDERRRRLLDLSRTGLRILGPHTLLPQRLLACLLAHRRRGLLDLPHELGDPGTVCLRGQVSPAGELAQDHLLRARKLPRLRLLAPQAGVVLELPVEPGPLHPVSGDQGLGAVDTGPVDGAVHQALLAGILQEVAQTLHLGGVLLRHQNRLGPARPDLVLPAGQPGNLPGQVAVEVTHELRELLRVLHLQQEVVMLCGVPSYAELASSAQSCCGRGRRRLRITLRPAKGGRPGETIPSGNWPRGQLR